MPEWTEAETVRIRSQLGRILESELFRQGERQSRFLRYIVEAELDGGGPIFVLLLGQIDSDGIVFHRVNIDPIAELRPNAPRMNSSANDDHFKRLFLQSAL